MRRRGGRWRTRWRIRRPRCPRCDRWLDTYATAGHLSVELDAETTALLLGEVPAAFHAGVQDILLIAFGLALAEFLGTGGRLRSASTSRATAATRS